MKIFLAVVLSILQVNKSAKEDYTSLMESFMNTTQLSFKYTYTHNTGSKTRVVTGLYRRCGDACLLMNNDYLILSSKEVTLTVFKDGKCMLLGKPIPPNNLILVYTKLSNPLEASITETGNSVDKIKEWEVLEKGWESKGYFRADLEKKILLEISYYRKDDIPSKVKPEINIRFSRVSLATQNKQSFDISKYIRKEGKRWVTAPGYSKYLLLNFTY